MSGRGWRGYETRPPWWPETEPFPPPRLRSSHPMQVRFYRRMALLFVTFLTLVMTGAFTLFWAVAGALGFVRPEGQPGRIFTRSQLLDAVHGVAFESYERAIDTHIKNLRRKLEPDPRQPTHILTVYGVGYRFADERA